MPAQGPSETAAKGRKDTAVDGSGSGAVIQRARAKPELPWLLSPLKDWCVTTQRSQVGWGSVRPLTSHELYGRNAFLHTTAAALRVQM